MTTYTGKCFDPMEMVPGDAEIEDIAHSLSLLCRGGGHLKYFYTVAQHCLNCANEAAARGWTQRLVLACLLHDASEAYISDIIRPVKRHLTNYLETEDAIMSVILKRFGLDDLSDEENRMWKQVDDEMLENELKLMLAGYEDSVPPKLSSVPDLEEHPHAETEQRFLELAKRLTGQI